MFKQLLFLGFIVIVSNTLDVTKEDEIYSLNSKNFDEFITSNKYVLVEFFSPYCIHCRLFAPDYIKITQILKEQSPEVKVAKVDITVEESLKNRFNIAYWPFLKFFVDGKDTSFEGSRSIDNVVAWAKNKSLSLIKTIGNVEDLEKVSNANDLLVLFAGDKSHGNFNILENLASNFKNITFVTSNDPIIKQQYNVSNDNMIFLLRKIDQSIIPFTNTLDSQSFLTFINQNKYPPTLDLTQELAVRIMNNYTQPILLLIIQNDEHGNHVANTFKSENLQIKSKILRLISNIHDGIGNRLAEYIGITQENLPAIVLIKPNIDNIPEKYLLQKDITPENLNEFIENYENNKLERYLKSEKIPISQNGPIHVLVGKTFKDIALNNENDVLVNFYTPWCEKCKILSPIYTELARNTHAIENLIISKLDISMNEFEGMHIQYYPMIKLYPSGKKDQAIEYNGHLSVGSISQWLKINAGKAKWPENLNNF